MEGLTLTASLLLMMSGSVKLGDPRATAGAVHRLVRPATAGSPTPASFSAARALGVVEVVVGLIIALVGGRLAGVLTAAAFALLAVVAARLATVAPDQACGCFGGRDATPAGRLHVVANLVLAAVGAVAVVFPAPGLLHLPANGPTWPVLAVSALLLAYLASRALTTLPALAAARRGRVVV